MKKGLIVLFSSLFAVISCNSSTPLTLKVNGFEITNIHSTTVSNFYLSEEYDYSNLPPEVNARVNQGDNLPINITWESNASEEAKYQLTFKEKDQTLHYEVVGKSFDFKNYKLNTSYELQIEVESTKSEVINFTTPKGYVRTIFIDGVDNFRDLGDGEKIKQGLLYRSMTFENNTIDKNDVHSISEEGLKEVINLGIKNEIDLRKSDEVGELAGKLEGINYQFMPLFYGGQNILTYKSAEYNNPEMIKNIVEFMAKEENYPMDFHCVRGTDRTGCIAFVIKGLLGVEEEFLKKDFIFSNFYNIGSSVKLESIEYTINPSAVTRYVNVLKQESGDTLQEKIYNYLHNKIGVSEEDLNSIINILKVD